MTEESKEQSRTYCNDRTIFISIFFFQTSYWNLAVSTFSINPECSLNEPKRFFEFFSAVQGTWSCCRVLDREQVSLGKHKYRTSGTLNGIGEIYFTC